MRYIFLNLKRFDVPPEAGGVNGIYPVNRWGACIAEKIRPRLEKYTNARFALFFPEAHILNAAEVLNGDCRAEVGCQSVHFEDISPGGNFGAFTSSLPAAAAAALGCKWTVIGHCEERAKLKSILQAGGVSDKSSAVNAILKKSVECAVSSGLNVLYCVGESAEEQPERKRVLKEQLSAVQVISASGSEKSPSVVIGYEPVWAIGPGKTPPEAEYIRETASYIKSLADCPVVYGGGLKTDNALMLAGINEIDGGLIALTRFKGEIGFYPDEYLEIVERYLGGSSDE